MDSLGLRDVGHRELVRQGTHEACVSWRSVGHDLSARGACGGAHLYDVLWRGCGLLVFRIRRERAVVDHRDVWSLCTWIAALARGVLGGQVSTVGNGAAICERVYGHAILQ